MFEAGSSARAIPFLMRASTVDLPFESTAENVTMVPSGPAFPEQSRIGAVSTRMPFCEGDAFMLMLHGSEAVSCTTRRTSFPASDAVNCAAPARDEDGIFTQATPYFDCAVRELEVPSTAISNLTGVGEMTRFWFLSNTKTVPLMTSGRAAGTRRGRTSRRRRTPGRTGPCAA